MAGSKVVYPFVPKSNAKLLPGQFWGVPLRDGRFACGRVLAIPPSGRYGSRTSFIAGLSTWVGACPPTAEALAGHGIAAQGGAHILTILENGREVLGWRDLASDGIEPAVERTSHFKGGLIRGYVVIEQSWKPEHEQYPVRTGWGFRVITIRAEKLFCRHS